LLRAQTRRLIKRHRNGYGGCGTRQALRVHDQELNTTSACATVFARKPSIRFKPTLHLLIPDGMGRLADPR
jgi:hypothetical protein